MQERVGSLPNTRSATVIGSESSRDPRTLTIRGFGWPQEEVSGSSFATWQAMCTRSPGFYFTGKCHQAKYLLSQPNPISGRRIPLLVSSLNGIDKWLFFSRGCVMEDTKIPRAGHSTGGASQEGF